MAEMNPEPFENIKDAVETNQEFLNTPEHFRVKLEVGGHVEYRQVGTNLSPTELTDVDMDRALRLQILPLRYGIELENGNVNVYEATELVYYNEPIDDTGECVDENDIEGTEYEEGYEVEVGYGSEADLDENDIERIEYGEVYDVEVGLGFNGYYDSHDRDDDESSFGEVEEEDEEEAEMEVSSTNPHL